MEVLEVPFFMGDRIGPLHPPAPSRLVAPDLGAGSPQERMGALYRRLAAEIADGSQDDPLVWAGDCVSVIGLLAGLQRRGIAPHLLFFDAHGDFNTWETTPSGFLGGMPLAMLTGRGEQTVVQAVGLKPLPDERVTLVDGRDLDPGEDEAVMASGIGRLPVAAVADALPPGPLLIHVDVDVVDPADMPAVNYPAPGGPSLEAVAGAVAALAATGRVVAASMSSWNPALPGAEVAAAATRRVLAALL